MAEIWDLHLMDGPFDGLNFAWPNAVNPGLTVQFIKNPTKLMYHVVSIDHQNHIIEMEQS